MLDDFDFTIDRDTSSPAVVPMWGRTGGSLVRSVIEARPRDAKFFEIARWTGHGMAGPDSITRVYDADADDGWTTLYIPQPLTRFVPRFVPRGDNTKYEQIAKRLKLVYKTIRRPLPIFEYSAEKGASRKTRLDLGIKFGIKLVHLMTDHDCTTKAFSIAKSTIADRERDEQKIAINRLTDPEADKEANEEDRKVIAWAKERYWLHIDAEFDEDLVAAAQARLAARAQMINDTIKSYTLTDEEREAEVLRLAFKISRYLKRHARQRFESIALALKRVGLGKGEGLYVSDYSSVRMMHARAKQRAWAEEQQIRTADGRVFKLSDIQDKAKRREAARIYRMNKDLERFAREIGFVPCFLTLTAPPRFHPNPSNGHDTWDGSTPAQSQRWLAQEWARLRARLAKSDVIMAGFRVPEGHGDACTHAHPLIYVHPDQRDAVEEAISYKWRIVEDKKKEKGKKREKNDNDENLERVDGFVGYQRANACVRWLDDEVEDGKRASAASYVMTYVLETLNSQPGEEDRARAWRQTWAIRGYQFFGVTTKKVWEALRHDGAVCAESVDAETALAIQYAKAGDFYNLLKMDGGIGIKDSDRKFSVEISDDEEDPDKRIIIVNKKEKKIFEYFKIKAVLETFGTTSYSYSTITQEGQSQSQSQNQGIPSGLDVGWVVISDKTGISYIPPPIPIMQ